MAVFPIHIIELLTLALVLLGAYRMFQAQSFEEQPSPENKSTPSATTQSPRIDDANKEKEKNNKQMSPSTDENIKSDHKPVCHQSVLNNYIGDFF